jgi:splicing factor 3B subunit 2
VKPGVGLKGAKGRGRGPAPKVTIKLATEKKAEDEEDIEVEYVIPEVLEGSDLQEDDEFKAVLERYKHVEPEVRDEDEDEKREEEPIARKRQKPKQSLLDEADDSDDSDGGPTKISKKKRRLAARMSVAELKTLVRRPDVVEVWDKDSADPRLLVYLKAYRNTVSIPRHWNSKRRYMAGKRGVEKPPFKLPEFIEQTGIAKIRQAIMERQSQQSLKQKNREKVHPKMGKLDIDYQVLHDAFFKYMTKPKMSKHNDMYYEGKEYEAQMMNKRPGQLSAALKEALGMAEGAPPPWLINMQRYGPPPAYPNLKIPGLNAPIPAGAEYGYHPGGWGKPPVDEFGNPLYGDWKAEQERPTAPEDLVLWGEIDDFDDDDDDDDDGVDGKDGTATPMLGTATPLVGTGSATPVVSMDGGVRSISGVSYITSGMDTPGTGGTRSRRGGIASVSGVSSASLTPTPQLFQVLEEQKARAGRGMYPSSHKYKISGSGSRGASTPIAGVGSSGTGTPIAGIGTPVLGIGTPHGISTPHGIGTPGMTPGAGTRTPHGIGTPIGMGTHTPGAGTGTPGAGTRTPHGIGTPHVGGIATPVGGIATPVGGIATPVGGIATPVGGIATPVGGIATPVGGIATPVGGIATPVGGVATPTGIPGGLAPTPVGGADTPGPVTMTLNPQDVEAEGILTADIIRQQLKQHEEAAAKAKIAAGQKEVEPRAPHREKKKKEKTKFKF